MKISRLIQCSTIFFVGMSKSLAATIAEAEPPPPLPPQYTLTDLGALGFVSATGTSINASGQVGGYLSTSLRVHIYGNNYTPVRWTGTSGTIVNGLGGADNQVFGINDSGQLAGIARTPGASTNPYHPVLWTGATATDLGTLGGTSGSANAINSSGQVAGFLSVAGESGAQAVRWTGTVPTLLGTLFGDSVGYGINASGQIAGYSVNNTGEFHAVRWTGTTPTDLGVGQGLAINTSGQVAGSNNLGHATVWTGTSASDLGTLGGSSSQANGINGLGVVVGMSFTTGDALYDPFISIGGIMYDLNNLIVPGSGAFEIRVNGINDSGQIVGSARFGGEQHAIRLNPVATVPEPSSALLALGSAAMVLSRRWRAKSQCVPS